MTSSPTVAAALPAAWTLRGRTSERTIVGSGLAEVVVTSRSRVGVRADRPGAWWTLQFGYGFEEATPERMVLIDEDLQPLSGGRPNPGVGRGTEPPAPGRSGSSGSVD